MIRIERQRALPLSLCLFFVGLFAFGCSTVPVSQTRSGLFDHLSKYEGRPASEVESASESDSEGSVQEARVLASEWSWPLRDVKITSEFGERDSGVHEGIDLKASTGTKVYSVSDGKVIYAGSKISGYGRMIILEHGHAKDQKGKYRPVYSVYAHLSKLRFKKGDRVKKGDFIALSGRSGRVTGPHLHFEIRHGTIALNPTKVLTAHKSTGRIYATDEKTRARR